MPLNSLQDLFDTVVRHLLTQKAKAMGGGPTLCRYRTPDGLLKCAAGALLIDACYDPKMEGKSAEAVVDQYGAHVFGIEALPPGLAVDLLNYLQVIHDRYEVYEWPSKLRECAGWKGLRPTVIDELAQEGKEFCAPGQ